MATNIYGFPQQKISNKKKNDDFHIRCAEALIKESAFNSTDKAHLKELYDIANNEINDKTYRYVTNPYNSEMFRKINFPARIRNYPIISPIISLLMGEKAKRPKNFQVIATNADSVTQAQQEMFNVSLDLYQRTFVNELNNIGYETGIPDQDTQTPKQVLENLSANPADQRAIVGQEAVDYLMYDLELIHEFQKLFYDYIVSGRTYTYKDVVRDEVIYEQVSPLDIDERKSPETEYTEDAESVVRRKLLSVSQVVDRFYDTLSPEEISELENPSQHREGGFFTPFYDNIDEKFHLDERLIEVIHCVWKSFKKIGILTYYDEFGPHQIEVDEDYEPLPNEEIDWIWVSEVRQTYRIDNKFYKDMGTIAVQRTDMDELSECKLPYNGISFSNRHSRNKSLVEMGIQFQVLYNIIHYRFELTMAKNKDNVILMPIDAIPKEEGWDEYKFMYYVDAMGFAFIKPTSEGVKGFNQYQVLNSQLGQYAKNTLEILAAIKAEWEETIGITRQRKGQVAASDSVAGTQEAVFRSSVITEEIFRKFEKFEERELQGLLDCSKYAWINGKKAVYLNSDMRKAILSIDPIQHMETNYAIFVRNSGKETEKFDLIKQYAQPAIQNGLPLSSMIDMLESNNFSKLKDIIRKAEEAQQQAEQQLEQAKLQQQQQLMELEIAQRQNELVEKDKQREFEANENELDRQNKIDIEILRAAHGLEANTDIDQDNVPDAAAILKNRNDQLKLSIDDKHETRKEDQKDRELDIKEKELKDKKEIEKLKARTALKNKVPGETKKK